MPVTTTKPTTQGAVPAVPLDGLEWRQLGPFRGGRVEAVAGDVRDRNTFYFGSCGGGVWKTTDGGIYWRNVSDGFFKRASVGAIAVSESDPNVVYAGMGEACIRGNVSHGDGVYRSTDGGRTWTHLGLADTRNIGKVRIHPQDPDIAFVAALGHAHGPNPERGIFRTRDGGKTWKKVLSRGNAAGGIDISIDPMNPRNIFASTWEAIRKPHQLISGGAGSGLFKSTDGGDTWTEISRNRGLPQGILGRIGVAVSPSRPDRIFALIEATDGGVFRSEDGGLTWSKGSDDRELRQRAWYYTHIHADPKDPETVWVLNVDAYRSSDAGRTFTRQSIPHGDNHDMWIDPNDPSRMIEGNDGGATISFNGGASWSSIYNQPTAEYYHITADSQTPYRLYAAQQDNSSISSPARSALSGILWGECYEVGGGEAGHIAVRQDDPNVVFAADHAGLLTRYDRTSRQIRTINVWPDATSGIAARHIKYRFNWTAPVFLSPHDQNTLYTASQYVHRSRDEGASWARVSPDLTRNDPRTTGDSGGPITLDQTGAEYHATIFAFTESPLQPGVLWAGTDDGVIQVSRNDGKKWTNVTPKLIPAQTLISMIEPGQHDAGTAYVAANRYKHDDFRPYIYKTTSYGKAWSKISTGIPADTFVRAVREDPEVPGLLYAGTEVGLYVSYDAGAHWQRWQGRSLPVVPLHDLIVKDGDLALATHGRSFWVFDDLTPVRELATKRATGKARLFTPRQTTRFKTYVGFGSKTEAAPMKNYKYPAGSQFAMLSEERPNGEKVEVFLDAGKNPPDGVIVTYFLRGTPKNITLTFQDGRGRTIRSFTKRPPNPDPTDKEPRVPAEPGMNRFVWDMRYPDAARIDDEPLVMDQLEGALKGGVAAPGAFAVRLTVDGEKSEAMFTIVKDPRIPATQKDLEAQFALRQKLRDLLDRDHRAVNRLRAARNDPRTTATTKRTLDAIESELMQPKAKSRQDTLNFGVRLNHRIGSLIASIGTADAAPTKQALELAGQLEAELKKLEDRLSVAIGRRGRRAT